MSKTTLKDAIARSRNVATAPENMTLLLQQIAKEVLAQHLSALEEEMRTYMESVRTKISKQAKDILTQVIRDNWEHLKGPPGRPGKPGTPGTNADRVDLEKVAKMAASLIVVPRPVVDDEKIKTHIKSLMPEPELDEAGELVELDATTILEKIHSVPGGIKPEAVSGLSVWMKNIQNSLREATRSKKDHGGGEGGGGGMGNVQHEQFNVSSSTTAVTLKYKIAANGYAIWAHYNNGYIVRTTDYTVGTNRKTLTFTFTPQDPIPGQVNQVNVVYIRA